MERRINKHFHIFDGGNALSIAVEMPYLRVMNESCYGVHQKKIENLFNLYLNNQNIQQISINYLGNGLAIKYLIFLENGNKGLFSKLESMEEIVKGDNRSVIYKTKGIDLTSEVEGLRTSFLLYNQLVNTLFYGVPEEKQLLLLELSKEKPEILSTYPNFGALFGQKSSGFNHKNHEN